MLIFNAGNRPYEEIEEGLEEREPQINIFSGDDRPIAVILDNHTAAWPHSGIEQAYKVYEIIVEGGETRLLALFKGQNVPVIGPTRSTRHYFLDYVLENDAIHVHFGWSPQARRDARSLGIDNVNGMADSRILEKFSKISTT